MDKYPITNSTSDERHTQKTRDTRTFTSHHASCTWSQWHHHKTVMLLFKVLYLSGIIFEKASIAEIVIWISAVSSCNQFMFIVMEVNWDLLKFSDLIEQPIKWQLKTLLCLCDSWSSVDAEMPKQQSCGWNISHYLWACIYEPTLCPLMKQIQYKVLSIKVPDQRSDMWYYTTRNVIIYIGHLGLLSREIYVRMNCACHLNVGAKKCTQNFGGEISESSYMGDSEGFKMYLQETRL